MSKHKRVEPMSLTYVRRIGRYGQYRGPRHIIQSAGKLYVSAYDAHAVFVIDAQTWKTERALRCAHLKHPRGLQIVANRLYVVCYGHPMGAVVVIDLLTLREIMCFAVPRPRGIVAFRGRLFVTQVWEHRVSVHDLDGRLQYHLYGGFCHPRGIDIDRRRQLLVIADSGNDRVVWLTLEGRVWSIRHGVHAPNDVVCCDHDTVITSEWYNRRLRVFWRGRLEEEVATVPEGSGDFAMMGRWRRHVFVSDNDKGCVHVFRRG